MISVAIPTYKRPNYLKKGIQSILSQTLLPDEIVISVDGKDAETLKVIESFKGAHPKVKVKHVVNEVAKGQWGNRRQSFELTTGDYVAMLDDDDMWHPEFIEKSYKALLQNPDCGFCFGKYLLMDPNENNLEKMSDDVDAYCGRSQMTTGKCMSVLHSILSYEALPFPLSCTLFRRSALEKVGYIPTFGIDLPDLALFLGLGANRINGYFIAERLGRYRVHDGQTTNWRVINAKSKVECFYEIYKQYNAILLEEERNLLKRRYLSSVLECAISLAHDRKRKDALTYLSRLFRLSFSAPSIKRMLVLLALLIGVHNKRLSYFRDSTPTLKYDNE